MLPKHVSWGYCIGKNDSDRITPKRSAKTGRHSIDIGGTSPKSGAVTGSVGVIALILAELLQESTAKTCQLGLLH